ncbi:OLC1v1018633C1 [Oldenlandia corymbosa var. corymbosa]|uniref:OLC1v1018633C1 n=1 Tax=Oldenlandia corymbosa var. corymbosa TaxID=529605 RepID=A0AAV1EC14_OLDCO|nr:OLC1v1018633C1 [Oldenlandia corymbosa var. corymbosa]
MFDAAQRVEHRQAKLRNFLNQKRSNTNAWLKPKGNIPPRRFEVPTEKRMSPSESAGQAQPVTDATPICAFCRKPGHLEKNCWFKQRRCLGCGSTEHYARECPKNRDRLGQSSQSGSTTPPKNLNRDASKPRVSARVFALGKRNEPESTDVVEGRGSTRSFG